ncbi:MAG: dihydroneopterin aldolase [Acidimicrobiia bacterium]
MCAQEIIVQGLRLTGNHGVTPAERAMPQPFEVDIVAETESADAQKSDRLEDTVDYEMLCAQAQKVIAGPPFSLLERVAAEIAEAVLDLGGIGRVTVTVKKLHPPMDYAVAYTAARVTRLANHQDSTYHASIAAD